MKAFIVLNIIDAPTQRIHQVKLSVCIIILNLDTKYVWSVYNEQ